MSEIIVGGHFEKAGYERDTKFKVIKGYNSFKVGDIVQLYKDDCTPCPTFINQEGDTEYMYLPSLVSPERRPELEVYVEEVAPEVVDDNPWIEWSGGECPVPKGTLVDVKYLDGKEVTGVTALTEVYEEGFSRVSGIERTAIYWYATTSGHTIVAYRLHKPEVVKVEGQSNPKGKWDDFVVGAKVTVVRHNYMTVVFPNPTLITGVSWEGRGQKCVSVVDIIGRDWNIVLGCGLHELSLAESNYVALHTSLEDEPTTSEYLSVEEQQNVTEESVAVPIAVVHNGFSVKIKGITHTLTHQELIDLYTAVDEELHG